MVGHNIVTSDVLELSILPTAHCVFDTVSNRSLNVIAHSERGKVQSL